MINKAPSDKDDVDWKDHILRRMFPFCFIIFNIVALLIIFVCSKTTGNAGNPTMINSSALRDIENAISSIQDIQDQIYIKVNRDTAKNADMYIGVDEKISMLANKVDRFAAQYTDMYVEMNEKVTLLISKTEDNLHSVSKSDSKQSKNVLKEVDEYGASIKFEKKRRSSPTELRNIEESSHDTESVSISHPPLHSSYDDERKLQLSILDHTPCTNEPRMLSPVSHLRDFYFDEELDEMLTTIYGMASMEYLRNFISPQYKAACLLLYNYKFDNSTERRFGLFIQSFIMTLFHVNTIGEFPPSFEFCSFSYVTCDTRGVIRRIFIDGTEYPNGTKVSLPSELAHLRQLVKLELPNVGLTGTIPSELGNLERLTHLDLSNSSLKGIIPSEIGRLSQLQVLLLGTNFLTGTIPSEIGNCDMLQKVVLFRNQLTGTFPPGLFNSKNIDVLHANTNLIIGTIPSEVGNMRNITSLRLNHNKLSGSIPSEIFELRELRELWLSENNLGGTIPEEIKYLNKIISLGISSTQLHGTIPDVFESFDLQSLYLNDNRLNGTIPKSLMTQMNLTFLSLDSNELTGYIDEELCEAIGGYNILVDDSPWFTRRPKVVCPCCEASMCHIDDNRVLNIGGISRPTCPASNIYTFSYFEKYYVLDHSTGLSRFVYASLDIDEKSLCLSPSGCYEINNFIDSPYNVQYSIKEGDFMETETCQTLNTCGRNLTIEDPRRVAFNRLLRLTVPDIRELTGVTNKALCWVIFEDDLYDEYEICDGTLYQRFILALFFFQQEEYYSPKDKKAEEKIFHKFVETRNNDTCDWLGVTCDSERRFVEHFNLPYNQLEGTLVSHIGMLETLKTLDLSNNSFTGTLDERTVANLPNLESINLSNNKFGGEIPREIFVYENLNYLNLSHNSFVGTLPPVSYSQNLLNFDVSNNILKGTIPSSLFASKKYERFCLSENVLTGIIPTEIGLLKNLSVLTLYENHLEGSIPLEVFDLPKLEVFAMHTNELTGSIPTEIGLFQNIKIVTLNHNSFKGTIPTEMSKFKQIERLLLHRNQLIGIAPDIRSAIQELEFITDCEVSGPLDCITCTICCEYDQPQGKCLENKVVKDQIWIRAFVVAGLIPICFAFLIYVYFYSFKSDRSPFLFISNDSVYCFVFSKNHTAFSLQCITAILQILLFIAFLNAADSRREGSDWTLTMKCSSHGVGCESEKFITMIGWALLLVLSLIFLGVDILNGMMAIHKSISLGSVELFFGGFQLLFLTIFALYTSAVYNRAIAETNTEMIVNAVILLFINDLDERLMAVLRNMFPKWTQKRIDEIEKLIADTLCSYDERSSFRFN